MVALLCGGERKIVCCLKLYLCALLLVHEIFVIVYVWFVNKSRKQSFINNVMKEIVTDPVFGEEVDWRHEIICHSSLSLLFFPPG